MGWEPASWSPGFPSDVQDYVKSWGFVGDGRLLFAEVETDGLTAFSEQYFLFAAVLLLDQGADSFSNDALSDERLPVGEPFVITGKRIRTEIHVSDAFEARINNTARIRVSYYLYLLPQTAKEAKIAMLDDGNKAGGHIIGNRRIYAGKPLATN